jgi:hypothetical protein
VVPVEIDSGVASELASARLNHSIAAKALQSLSAAHAKAEANVAEAERAVVAQVDQIFREEDIEDARKVARHLDAATNLGKSLLMLAIAGELNGAQPHDEVTKVLARLDLPLVDRRHVGVNLLRDGDQAAAARRAARRAALIAGEGIEEEAAA